MQPVTEQNLDWIATLPKRMELELRFSAKLTVHQRAQFRDIVQDVLTKHGTPPTTITCCEGSTELLVTWDPGAILLVGTGLLVTSIITGFGREIGKAVMDWMRTSGKTDDKRSPVELPKMNPLPQPVEVELIRQNPKIVAFREDLRERIKHVLENATLGTGDIVLTQRSVLEDAELDVEYILERTIEVQNWEVKKMTEENRTRTSSSKQKINRTK